MRFHRTGSGDHRGRGMGGRSLHSRSAAHASRDLADIDVDVDVDVD
jgi:hypothetical protein